MKRLLATLFLSSALCFPASANMQASLEKAFSTLGMAHNVTPEGGWQDQSGGFYSGGSVFARGKVHQAELASLQMPHYRAGCGGIDLFLGGFSFINAQEFTALLRNIGANASGYAFNLALATVTPQIKSVLDDLLARVQNMTNQSINSCEAAASLVGGVWPQSDASSQLLCNSMSKELGVVTDWAQSRQKCGAGGERDGVNARKREVAGFVDILGDEFNLAWKAIHKNAFLSADPKLAEFFMTISGTIVSRKAGGSSTMIVFPSKSGDGDLISALLLGNIPAPIYACDDPDENKCLNLRSKSQVIPQDKSLSYKVESLLNKIKDRLLKDQALTAEQQGFINSTMIPVLKIMAVEMAFKQGGSPISLNTYRDAIAHDILLQYLDEVMDLVWQSATHLKQVQIDDEQIEAFRIGIADSRKLLFSKRTALFQQISITLEAIERTQQIEQKLQNQFISQQQGTKE